MAETTGERYSTNYNDGAVIAAEGPGKGFASTPWVLDDYERDLGISPAESWLMRRLVKHVWKRDGVAFPSVRKIARRAEVTRPTIYKLLNSLMRKGYLDIADDQGPDLDRRVRYDVSGLYFALNCAIKCDPDSKWAKENGGAYADLGQLFNDSGWSRFKTPADVYRHLNPVGKRFNWAVGAAEDWEETRTDQRFRCACDECGDEFTAGAAHAKYCPECRAARRQERWEEFRRSFGRMAEVMDDEE